MQSRQQTTTNLSQEQAQSLHQRGNTVKPPRTGLGSSAGFRALGSGTECNPYGDSNVSLFICAWDCIRLTSRVYGFMTVYR